MIGELLSICLESYMELLITGFMAVRAKLWRKVGDILGNILAYFCLSIVMFILPFFAGFITITEKESIKSKKLKYVCQSLYEGIRVQHSLTRVSHLSLIFKRIIFLSVAFFTDDTTVQLFIVSLINIGSVLYIGLA